MPKRTKKGIKKQTNKTKTKKNIFKFDAAKIHPASLIFPKKYPL